MLSGSEGDKQAAAGVCQQLQELAAAGRVAEVRRLLAADLHLLDAAGPDGLAALHHASQNMQLEATEALLLAGADASVGSCDAGADGPPAGTTPLHFAAVSDAPGGARMVRLLLNHGADAAAADSNSATALHQAAAFSCGTQSLLCLARHSPRQLCAAAGHRRESPVHILCRRLDEPEPSVPLSMLHALAAAGMLHGPSLHQTDAQGKTPLCMAASAGHAEAVSLLLACGASPDAGCCQSCTKNLPEQPTCLPCWPGRARWHAEGSLEAVRAMLRVHTCPLAAACCHPRGHEAALLLLAAGASAQGLSPQALYRAARKGRADVAAALLEAGAPCDSGFPLLRAVSAGNEELVAALLDGGESRYACFRQARLHSPAPHLAPCPCRCRGGSQLLW